MATAYKMSIRTIGVYEVMAHQNMVPFVLTYYNTQTKHMPLVPVTNVVATADP